MPEVWESYKLYMQRMKEDCLDPILSLEKNDLVGQRRITSTQVTAVIKGYRVLKALYERHIEFKQVPFHRLKNVINPKEREEIENDKKLLSYSRAFDHDLRRSKCINMLNNIRKSFFMF